MAFQFKKKEKAVIFCTKCGQDGHTHITCQRDKVCNRCHQAGHIARDCTLPKEVTKRTAAELREHNKYYDTGKRDSVQKKGALDPMAYTDMALTSPSSKRIKQTAASEATAVEKVGQEDLFVPPPWAVVPTARYVLVDEVGGGQELRLYASEEEGGQGRACYLLGKHPDLVQCLRSHPSVSRVHCAILHYTESAEDAEEPSSGVKVVDLFSTGGTFVDGNILPADGTTAVLLPVGGTLRLGGDALLTLKKKSRWEE